MKRSQAGTAEDDNADFYKHKKKQMSNYSEDQLKAYVKRRIGKLYIFDKTRCLEMFTGVTIDKMHMYEQRSVR